MDRGKPVGFPASCPSLPGEGEVNKEEAEAVEEVLESCPRERRHLIRVLQAIQEKLGYLPEEAMREVAHFLGISPAEVFGVATFYNQFRFVPLGKFHIVVCMGTACHSMGGALVLDAFQRELGIKVGEVTPDRKYSLDRVGCIGCCTQAPVVVVNGRIFPKMTPYKVEEVLAKLKAEDELGGDKEQG